MKLYKKISSSNKIYDLIFQIIDWRSYDNYEEKENDDDDDDEEEFSEKKIKKERKLIIRGYGVTENGNSICLHIKDFLTI